VSRRLSTGGPWERPAGYSRAVAAGDYVFVSGCTSMAGDRLVHEGDHHAQTEQAIANVAEALTALGSGLADVVRTRMFVTDISKSAEYGRAHGAAFGEIRPASSMIGITALIDPRMLIEVEAVAYRPGIGPSGPAETELVTSA
jgi:enamine deaminase RidA (YjgF/YER057c/UK114 family)